MAGVQPVPPPGAPFSPVAGREVEIELDYDLPGGRAWVYVDSSLLGSLTFRSFGRAEPTDGIYIGQNGFRRSTPGADFWIDSMETFATMQHHE